MVFSDLKKSALSFEKTSFALPDGNKYKPDQNSKNMTLPTPYLACSVSHLGTHETFIFRPAQPKVLCSHNFSGGNDLFTTIAA
jgi:hypothetical protein